LRQKSNEDRTGLEMLKRRRLLSNPEAAPLDLFRFLLDAGAAGLRGALVTVTGLTGPGARSAGAQMAVLENGDRAGSLSGGCVEAAIVAEAREALREGLPRQVRFGAASPYIDIRLPCGGGMDLLFLPDPSPEAIGHAASLLAERRPVRMSIGLSGRLDVHAGPDPEACGWAGDTFNLCHRPPLRLIVAGHGAEMPASARVARSCGAEVELLSPDDEIVDAAAALDARAEILRSIGAAPALAADRWTAILLLFHDHDWEPALLEAALATPAFWIGAMGSRRTHEARLAHLAERGVPAAQRKRVHGPVGLIPSARDPATLALSAVAQIVEAYQTLPA
jgi:xanthine dehydrogenase accessory factor